MLINCLFVGLGGFAGSVLRYLISKISFLNNHSIPCQTLIVNIIGAFAIGLIMGFAAKNNTEKSSLILFLQVGICGGFTTFSTFSAETLGFFEKGNTLMGIIYIVLSVSLCIAGVLLGKITAANAGI